MYTLDDIQEVMADEIGGFADGARRNGFFVTDNEEVKPVAPQIFNRRQYSANRPSWPESETYPSARGKSGRMGSK